MALLLSGCVKVGPDYVAPEPAVPARWAIATVLAPQPPADTQALAGWWRTLGDSVLTGLVERGLGANLDIRQAEARVLEARARRGVASAQRYPAVTAGAGARTSRVSGETVADSAVSARSTTLFSAGLDASWEVDLFGRRRRGLEVATASLGATVEDLRDVLVTLTSDIALNYLDVRLAQARLATANANLGIQLETHEIARFRFQAGLVTQLDVEQARLNLAQTRAAIPPLSADLTQATNRLAVLLGQAPGTLAEELAAPGAIPTAPVTIAVGLPADVLRRRPDVRRAERLLAAQTAQVGVATADRFPSLSLLGSIGLDALSLGKLLSAAARTLVGSVSANQTVFDAGRIRGGIAAETAAQQRLAAGYEASVLIALEDVENALVAYAEEQARREALVEAADAARTAFALADQRYRSGLIDFPVVLDAQRSLLSADDQLAVSTGTVTSNLIRLYRAAGGGWSPPASSPSR